MKSSVLLLSGGLALAAPALAADVKPTDPAAPAPSITYRSTFEGYRPFREEPIADWHALNAEVGAAGGHIGIMGGAAGHAGHAAGSAKPAAAKPPAAKGGQAAARGAPQAPAGRPHSGH